MDTISLSVIALFAGYLAYRVVDALADYLEALADERSAFADLHRANLEFSEAEFEERFPNREA